MIEVDEAEAKTGEEETVRIKRASSPSRKMATTEEEVEVTEGTEVEVIEVPKEETTMPEKVVSREVVQDPQEVTDLQEPEPIRMATSQVLLPPLLTQLR